jgi:hypothetical protein
LVEVRVEDLLLFKEEEAVVVYLVIISLHQVH